MNAYIVSFHSKKIGLQYFHGDDLPCPVANAIDVRSSHGVIDTHQGGRYGFSGNISVIKGIRRHGVVVVASRQLFSPEASFIQRFVRTGSLIPHDGETTLPAAAPLPSWQD